jgi:hypothetical protein
MSLEKMYSSRPFKAMAALLFGVMILSACQEAAHQVADTISNSPVAQDVANQAATFEKRAQTHQLTDEETIMLNAFSHAQATKKLIMLKNAMTLRYYSAAKAGKKVV